MNKKSVWIFTLVFFLVLAVSVSFGNRVYAEENDSSGNAHYLGFASDLHGLENVLENAFGQFAEAPEYVSLIGDMVGAKAMGAPEYDSGAVLARITGVFPDINQENSNASIIWADHDAGVNDDAGIVKCMGDPAGYLSELIYEGKNEDGSTAYYIYGIGYYHMITGGEISSNAAEAFKDWVSGVDKSIPVIVLCHVPLQAKRGDNLGAYYWNEALNYAATGVEGITLEDAEDVEIIRNVLFLYGHNHTTDTTEYVFEAGTTMNVQIDTGNPLLTSGEYDNLIIETDVYDEELAEGSGISEDDGSGESLAGGPNGKAQGISSRIYYTALVSGYLKTGGTATMLEITDNAISLTKYNENGETALGMTDDGQSVASPLVIGSVQSENNELLITEQPEDVCATYPEEVRFHVGVNHPERVASYQWYESDGKTFFELDGITAKTDTLIFPSTVWSENPFYLECKITDIDGNVLWSDSAELSISNTYERLPVLYVGEYALLPGESLDLSDTIFGSGIVTFAEDMSSMTLDHVQFNDDLFVADGLNSPATGLLLTGIPEEENRQFAIHCIGDNVIDNTFFDGYNSGGISISLFFSPHYAETIPTVTIDGDGTLTVLGGERCIDADTHLIIEVPLTLKTLEDHYCDALRSKYDITIGKGVTVDITSVGEGIGAGGIFTMEEGSSLSINMGAPFFMVGSGTAAAIRGTRGVSCTDAQITINGLAKPDKFIVDGKVLERCGGFIGIKTTDGNIILDSTKVSVEFTVVKAEELYMAALRGLAGDVTVTDFVMKNGSEFSMKLNDNPDVKVACGIGMLKSAVIEDSTIDMDLASSGSTGGIGDHYAVDIHHLTIRDSRIDIQTECTGDESSWGIRCMGPAEISLSDSNYYIHSKAAQGPALAALFEWNESAPDSYSYDPDYQPKQLLLQGKEQIELPAGGVISSCELPDESSGMGIFYADTVYDLSDTTKAASEILIRGPYVPDEAANEAADVRDEAIVALAQLDSLINKSLYTTATYAVYKDAYDAFKALVLDDEVSAADIRKARGAVTKAYVQLIEKEKQSLTLKADKKSVGYAALASASKTYSLITVSGNVGTLKYSKSSGSAQLTVNSKTGKITVKKGTSAGTYTAVIKVTAGATDDFLSASKTVKVTVTVKKAAQPMTAKGSTKTVKAADVKKANQSVTGGISVSKAQGKVTYKKISGSSKITINSSTGRITVMKDLAKGTYKVKIKVTAAGNKNYKAGSKTVTVTIKVS